MSAHDLIDMLKRIDYPEAKKLDPTSMDWAFGDPSTASFMQWVCSIGKENALTKHEITQYKNLMKEGEVLTGSHLEKAFQMSENKEEEDETYLQSDVEQLVEKLQKLKERKKTLVEERRQMDVKQMTLKSRLTAVKDLDDKAKRNYKEVLEASNCHSSKIDGALKELTQSIRNIAEVYKTDCDRESKVGFVGKHITDPVFLSQVNLSQYHQAEERLSQDLTAFTKKRFFEGMANLTGEKETSQYSILDVSSPDNIDKCRGEGDSTFMEDCQELALLQQIFPQSEIDRLNALVNAKKAMYAVQEAKKILRLLKTDQFPASASSINYLQSRVSDSVHQVRDEASQYESIIPELVKQLGTLQGTEILSGNYDLKLKRQDYFTKNQDKIIDYLESQRSRSDLLIMLYDLELKFHEKTHHLLCAAEKTLHKYLLDWKQRMKCLDDPDLSCAQIERNVIDARDTTSNSIYQMTAKFTSNPGLDDKHLYLPLDKVKDRAVSLYSTFEASQQAHQVEDEALTQNMTELEDCVKRYESALYSDSSTQAGIPNLSPSDVQASMVTLQGHISSLRMRIEKDMKVISNKKKMVKENPVFNKERELFTLFHTKPGRLTSTIKALEEKMKIQDVK